MGSAYEFVSASCRSGDWPDKPMDINFLVSIVQHVHSEVLWEDYTYNDGKHMLQG